PLEAHAGGQLLPANLLHQADGLAGAGAGGRVAGDFGGRLGVVVVDDGRAGHVPDGDHRLQRYHVAGGVTDAEPADVLGAQAVVGVGLDVDLPVAAIERDVVDVGGPQVDLE